MTEKSQGWQGCAHLQEVRDKMSKPTKREEALHVVRYIFGLKNFLPTV